MGPLLPARSQPVYVMVGGLGQSSLLGTPKFSGSRGSSQRLLQEGSGVPGELTATEFCFGMGYVIRKDGDVGGHHVHRGQPLLRLMAASTLALCVTSEARPGPGPTEE